MLHAARTFALSCLLTCLAAASYAQHATSELSLEEQRDLAWLLLITEPADVRDAAPLTALDDAVLAGLALPEHIDPRHRLPDYASHDAAQLSLTQLVEVATAYRLRHDAPQAVRYYELIVERSAEPRHLFFYAQALRDAGYTASAERAMQRYQAMRVAGSTT